MTKISFIVISLCFIVTTSCLILYFFQEKFIFITKKTLNKDYKFNFLNQFEEVFINTNGSNYVNALHFKLQNPSGVILFCHGNKGNLIKWGSRVSYLLKYNYEVLVFDYRNYGKSTGIFNESDMYKDALAVYNYLKQDYQENKIVVYGFSLGGTFATKIAAKNNPKELILEAPFYNFKKAVRFYSKILPTFFLRYHFRTDLDIAKVNVPITIFHGNKDKITSFNQSLQLFALNNNKNNQLIGIAKGTHNNIRDFKEYHQKMKEILER